MFNLRTVAAGDRLHLGLDLRLRRGFFQRQLVGVRDAFFLSRIFLRQRQTQSGNRKLAVLGFQDQRALSVQQRFQQRIQRTDLSDRPGRNLRRVQPLFQLDQISLLLLRDRRRINRVDQRLKILFKRILGLGQQLGHLNVVTGRRRADSHRDRLRPVGVHIKSAHHGTGQRLLFLRSISILNQD